MSLISDFVREASGGGTTRYKDTGLGPSIRSSTVKSLLDVLDATIGSRYKDRNDMAVEMTPDLSLGALLSISLAHAATTGCVSTSP